MKSNTKFLPGYENLTPEQRIEKWQEHCTAVRKELNDRMQAEGQAVMDEWIKADR